jgi:UbiD family decarboxylase
MQLHDRASAGIKFSRGSHLGKHLRQHEERGEPMEMAVVIGVDETVIIAAATGVAEGVDEFAVAGGLKGRPLKLVRCATVDLHVPAEAEIVIEGVIMPGERRPEGPFGEFTGYYSPGGNSCPVFRVRAIMHRDRPIFRGTLTGKPTAEDHQLFRLIGRAGLLNFGGPPAVRWLENLVFGSGLFPRLHWIYPLAALLRGRAKRWPRLCLPPKDLMERVAREEAA